jgi:RNA polymerase sigma factor (sigma-70 family)
MNAEPINAVLQHLRRQAAAEASAHLSDAQLLSRFLDAREEGAFAALLHRHGPMVWRVCRRALGRRHDAEDVFQATFLTLVTKGSGIRKLDSLAAWLHGVAARLAARVQQRNGRTVNAAPDPRQPGADLAEQAGRREEQAAFDEELARLPDRLRLPLVLCYLEGKTRDEAAEQLGWSLGTFKRRLDSARKLLAGRLAVRGVELGAVLLGLSLASESALAAAPSALAGATCIAAAKVAAGAAVREALSAQAALLVEGASGVAGGKLKLTVLFVAGVLALAGGVGLAFGPPRERPPPASASAPALPPPAEQPPPVEPPPPQGQEPPPAQAVQPPPQAPQPPAQPDARGKHREHEDEEDHGEYQRRRSDDGANRERAGSLGRPRKREAEDERRESSRSSRKKKPDGKRREKDD